MKNKSREIARSAEEFVWFEHDERNLEDDLIKGKPRKDYQMIPGVNEFVWFEDGDKKSKDQIEMTSREIIDEHVEKVPELNENIDKQIENVLQSNPNMIL